MFHTSPTLAATLVALALLVSSCARDDSASMLASAKDYLAKNDTKAAIIQLRNARQKAPNDPEVRLLLGKTLVETGEAVAAESDLRKAYELKVDPNVVVPLLVQSVVSQLDYKRAVNEFGSTQLTDPKARATLATTLAIAHVSLGELKQGRTLMEAALAADPGNVRAQVLRAKLAAQAHDLAGAATGVEAALALAPNDVEALVFKADLLESQGKRDEGIRLLEQAAASSPGALHPRYILATKRILARDREKAESLLAEMKKISPNALATLYVEALLAVTYGEPAKARDLAERVLKDNSNHVGALYVAALAHAQLKNWTTAEEMLRKVIAQAPDDPGPRRVLVAVYLRSGRPAQAVEAVDVALRRTPDDPVMLRLAGEARILSGNAAEAARYYERAAGLDKSGNASQLRLAQIRLATGDIGRALGDLERLASLTEPANIQAELSLYAAHIKQREYDKALQAVASIEKKQPKSAVAHELRGVVYGAQRKLKEARAEFVAALEADPKRVSSARSLAMIDLQEGKAADARARYEKMLAADPNNDQAMIALAEIQAMSGAPAADVKAALDRAIAANPTSPGPRIALMLHHRRIGDVKGAVEAARAAAAALPADPQILELYGGLQLATADHPGARDTFMRLAQLQPNNPMPLLRVSETYIVGRDFVSALDVQRKALALQPDNTSTLIAIATTYLLAGKPADAVAEARRLQREKPKEALGYALESEILAAQKKYGEAAGAMREAIARQPHPALAMRQVVLLTAAERTQEANAFAQKWIGEHPKDEQFLTLLGQQRQQRKDVAGAIAAYRSALDVNPENVVVLNNLAWVLNEQGKPEAREYAERAYRLAPLQPNVVDTYASVLIRQGDTARGIALVRTAMNLQPNDPRFRINLARGLAKSGDKASARKELEQVVNGDPRSPAKAEAEQLLREL